MSEDRNWLPLYDPYGFSHAVPQRDQWIDIRYGTDGKITTHRYSDLHPMMNVINLYWRPSIFSAGGIEIEGKLVGDAGIEPATFPV